jgi:hypothetical protein
MKAPNGKPSNLSPEQYKLVRTPAFKKWFGDWEKSPETSSKVVDENGEPLVVYHGTTKDFNVFKIADKYRSEWGIRDYGMYFSNSEFTAKEYSLDYAYKTDEYQEWDNKLEEYKKQQDWESWKKLYEEKKDQFSKNYSKAYKSIRVIKCFLNITNPFIIEGNGNYWYKVLKGATDIAIDNKNDGIIALNIKEVFEDVQNTYVVFQPNQIKLADGTNTTFDANNNDIRYSYGGELEKLGLTEKEVEQWEKEHKVSQRQNQNSNVLEYAQKLSTGEISQDEYIKSVRKYLPINEFKEVPKIPTLLEIVGSLKSNQIETGIIGYTKFINDGEMVATRLDIPAYNEYDTWIVSVHDGLKEGTSIGYGQTAYLENVKFVTSPKVALNIATNRNTKTTFARMKGNWINKDPKEVREMAIKYMNDPNWVQVGMNPYRHSWFYDKSDGLPLLSAEKIVQVGALVLAKNAVKTTVDDPIFIVNKNNPDIKFKQGGTIKQFIYTIGGL